MTEEETAASLGLTVDEMHEADRVYQEGLAAMSGGRGALVHLELTFIDGEAVCTGMSIHPNPGTLLTKAEVEMVGHFVGLGDYVRGFYPVRLRIGIGRREGLWYVIRQEGYDTPMILDPGYEDMETARRHANLIAAGHESDLTDRGVPWIKTT